MVGRAGLDQGRRLSSVLRHSAQHHSQMERRRGLDPRLHQAVRLHRHQGTRRRARQQRPDRRCRTAGSPCASTATAASRRTSSKDGKKIVLADKYMGKRFNSPNDLVYHSNGDLYFTDPPYGLEKGWEDPARELDFCGVYRLDKDGTVDAADQGHDQAQRHRPLARREDALRRQLRSGEGDLDGLPRQAGRHHRQGQGLLRRHQDGSARTSPACPTA